MNEIREDLKAYLDGELSPERGAEVQAAIEADPTLREEVEFMKALGFEIKRMKAEPAVQGAEKALERVRRVRPSWLLRNRWMLGSAMMAVMLLAIVPPMMRRSNDAAAFTPSAEAGIAIDKAKVESPGDYAFKDGATGTTGATGSTGSTGSGGGGGFATGGLPARGRKGAMESDSFSDVPSPREEAGESTTGRMAGKKLEQAPLSRNMVTLGTSAPNGTIPPEHNLIPQLLIRTANVTVKVESAQKALSDAIRIAQSVGGYSSGDNLSVSEGTTAIATVSLRVPVRSFQKVREDLLKLGTMVENNSNTDDVTTQVADTEARLKVLRAEEDSYVTMLRGAKRIGDLMEIKDRLSSVRQEIESLDSQRKALRDQASYSTINATFTEKAKVDEPAPPKDWTEDTWANAVNGLKAVGRFLAQGAIFLFVYSPLWLPVVAFGWWMSRRAKKV